LNCDGEDDLVFSDPRADTVDATNQNNGRLWVIWGPFAKEQYTDISKLSATAALKFEGMTNEENFSYSLVPIGDFSEAAGSTCTDIAFVASRADSGGLTNNGHV